MRRIGLVLPLLMLACSSGAASSPAALATGTQPLTYTATFTSAGQSIWGPGPSYSGPSGFNLFDYTWDKSSTSGSISDGFGATITGKTTGEIGLRLRYDNPTSGYVNVTYPTQVSLTQGRGPGGSITIGSNWGQAPGASLHTQSANDSAHLEALLQMGMNASADACLADLCKSTTLADNPSVADTGWTQIARTLTADDPTAPIGYDKAGIDGSVQFPSITTDSTQIQSDGSLRSGGSDTFLTMDGDLVALLNALIEDPIPTSLDVKDLTYTTLSAGLNAQIQMRQNFVFQGKGVQITLSFGGVVAHYQVLNPDGTVLTEGNGSTVTYEAGQGIRLFPPPGVGVLHVVPSFTLENSFESLDGLETQYKLEAQALALSYNIASYSGSFGPVMDEEEPIPTCQAQVYALSLIPQIDPYGCDDGNFWITLPPASYNTWSLGGFNTVQEQPFDLTFDTTPPATTPSLAPPANGSGWENADTTVTLNAVDYPNDGTASGVDKTYYSIDNAACTPSSLASCAVYDPSSKPVVSAEGRHTVYFFSDDNAGNYEAQKSIAVNVDKTAPTIQGGPVNGDGSARPANQYGWYNSPVQIHFACNDPVPSDGGAPSGIAACLGDTTLNEGADQMDTGTARDRAGNSKQTSAGPINIDMTNPVVSYTGNAGTYTVDQTVNITCNVSDPTSNGTASGIDASTNTCQNISGPAYSFHVANYAGSGSGVNSYSAQVYDRAGNRGTGSTSFTVTATFDSLCTLTQRFSTDAGVANGLCAKLSAAAAARARGDTGPMDNILDAYTHQVAAQSGKALTAQQADTLTKLAQSLM